MPKLREQLEASGCKIMEETSDRIVVSCPPNILESGLKIEGVKNIQTERKDKEITLIMEKEKKE